MHEFATQHQKTGGPIYTVEGATETKYETIFYAMALPTEDNWEIPNNINKELFDTQMRNKFYFNPAKLCSIWK